MDKYYPISEQESRFKNIFKDFKKSFKTNNNGKSVEFQKNYSDKLIKNKNDKLFKNNTDIEIDNVN